MFSTICSFERRPSSSPRVGKKQFVVCWKKKNNHWYIYSDSVKAAKIRSVLSTHQRWNESRKLQKYPLYNDYA